MSAMYVAVARTWLNDSSYVSQATTPPTELMGPPPDAVGPGALPRAAHR